MLKTPTQNRSKLALLSLLDMSAAFDSVDHDTLLQRLQTSYGLGGNVIAWFASYLTGRTQYVRTAASRSISLAVLFGVPQGSVLGPILFLLYVADLLQLVKRHGLHPHCYADDTQIYGFCDPSDVDALQERLSVCIDEVFSWMMSNRLQLNPSKTEMLWCSSARRQHQIPTGPVRVGDTSVQPVRTVRNLGVYIDADVTMSAHVTAVVKACFCSTPSNTQCASFDDTHHLVDTSACTCADTGGLLQLSSLGYFRTTVTTAAVCLYKCLDEVCYL